MKRFTVFALCLCMAASAWAQSKGTNANALSGFLLVTADKDWREKWDASSSNPQTLKSVKTIARGNQVFFLTFFSNPTLKANGRADLTCDFEAALPNGKLAVHQTDLVCFDAVLTQDPRRSYLALPAFHFTAQSSDPLGTYTVRMTIKDKVGNTVLPLKASFVVE